jgi:hypothetical protein
MVRDVLCSCDLVHSTLLQYDAGYHNIVNIDFSPVVIELMRRKHAEVASAYNPFAHDLFVT